VLNLTFALNYASDGLDVRGYRLGNMLLHAGAGFLLWGILRRIPAVGGPGVALAAAALWAVHPLQTASVTYVVQRAELLAGLFGLLTLYGFIRGAGGAKRTWFGVAVISCWLGVGTKETVAVIPLVVLLYDRTFVAGTFGAAWRARGWIHAGLCASWLPLAALVWTNHARGGSAGVGVIGAGDYFLTQAGAIVHYLRLAAWPAGQVFDYGVSVAAGFGAVWWQFLLLAGCAGATLWGLGRNRPVAFAGACFLLLLAPSSSILPVATQTIAEHRMYLALAVPVVLACLAARAGLRRLALPPAAAGWIAAACVCALGTVTVLRNQVYRSELALWGDTVAKRPDNPRAHYNFARALRQAGRTDEAAAEFRRTLELQPNHAFAHFQLGTLAMVANQPAAAIPRFEAALAADAGYVDARVNLGQSLALVGRTDEAIAQFERALAADPGAADIRAGLAAAHYTRGNLRAKQQQFPGAMDDFNETLRLDPAHVAARNNLANCQLVTGRFEEAIGNYEAVLRVRPGDVAVERNLALAREQQR